MHTPVAAVPGVAHLVPSVAPLAHTNETKASSSPQRTVSVPVTRRKGGAGAGSPFGPGGPAEPGGPASPCTLCARWTSRPLWTRHGLAASADCQHREKSKTVQKLPHRQTLQQCATACIHQLSTVKKPKVCDVRFYSQKRTCALHSRMSAMGQKQTFVESGVIALAADSFQGLASTALA